MIKKHVLFTKTLIIGFIILFIGISAYPSNGSILDKKIIKPIFNGKILYVGGSGEGNYTSIQDALDNATDEDTVFVYDDSSPYYEDKIQVSKSIDLIGEDKETTIIEGGGFEKVIIITADNVTISGFTIQKSGSGTTNVLEWTKAGIYNQGADNTKIYNNIIQNNRGEGICIRSSQNCTVENNLIRENGFRGMLIFKGSHNSLITRNTIRNNSKNGVLGVGLKNLRVIENNILFNDDEDSFGGIYGIELRSTYDSIVECNNFFENRLDAGFTFYGSTGSMNWIDYFLEFLKEIKKGLSLKFDANYWNKGRILPFQIYLGYVEIEGPFSWAYHTFQYSKFDWRPALKPYDIGV